MRRASEVGVVSTCSYAALLSVNACIQQKFPQSQGLKPLEVSTQQLFVLVLVQNFR